MLDLLACGKLVDNSVEKSVKKSWKLVVQNQKVGISFKHFSNELFKKSAFARNCGNILNTFYTLKRSISNLLNMGFPLFPQTSTTVTTIYLINKKGH